MGGSGISNKLVTTDQFVNFLEFIIYISAIKEGVPASLLARVTPANSCAVIGEKREQ